MNILLIGNGNMGKTIKNYFKKSSHKIIDTLHLKHQKYTKNTPIDIVIDFSSPKGLNTSLRYALLYKIPLIIGTTSFNIDELKRIENASKKIPISLESNYSIVFHRFNYIKQYLSNDKLEKNEYILETHHKNKVDIPSGSAIKLNKSGADIYSFRGASCFGEHEVRYLYKNEQITIKHTANNRDIFVEGVEFVMNKIINYKNGLYSLDYFIKGDL